MSKITSPTDSIGQPVLVPARHDQPAQRRVTLVHDWLLGMRGGEWVLAALLRLFPQADIQTLFYHPEAISSQINKQAIHPSVLGRLPGVRRYYRCLLPLMPWGVERMRIDPCRELVVSISHCVAHGVQAPPDALHINYCLSPMRYLYDMRDLYQNHGGPAGRVLKWIEPRLRRWDREAAGRAHQIWAISQFVARRIEKAYGRTARVIYPPVRTEFFRPPDDPQRNDEALLVSAMVPYKRVNLAIRAANRLQRPLCIVGDGPLLGQMQRAAGPTVRFEGRVSNERLRELYQTRRQLIYCAEEDFGLVPLEAMACGMPVLALRAGGLLETLREGVCGAFFDTPDTPSLAEAWDAFDAQTYDSSALRAHTERFSEVRFLDAFTQALDEARHRP